MASSATINKSNELNQPVQARCDPELLAAARDLGLDLDETFDRALRRAVADRRRAQQWYEENKEAVDKYNTWVEKNGTLLGDIQALRL